MKFLYPSWLYALLLLPLVYGLLLLDERRRRTLFSSFIAQPLWSRIVPDLSPRYREKRGLLFLAGMGFLFLALARPQFGSHEETITTTGLDLMVVLDVSNSMEVEDVVPSRLKKAKHLIKSVLDRLGGDRVGIVAFAEGASLACPLTTDLDYVLDIAQRLDPRSIQSQGTDIGIGLDTAFRSLERGAEGKINSGGTVGEEATASTTHVILLVSDGEDHENGALEIAEKLKKSGIRLYVLGVGTEKGGPIPLRDESGTPNGFKRDRSGQAIVSTFHSDFLSRLADAAGGKYWTLTESESEIQDLLQDLGTLDRSSLQERRYRVYDERFQIPLCLALALFFLELAVPARRRAQGVGLVLVLSFFLPRAGFSETQGPAPLDVYLENQKGLKAFKAGQIDEARKSFGAAQARDPSRPELEFNQGVVELENGDPERAAQGFLKSAKEAQDPRLESKSYYNLGQAFTKKGDLKSAIQGYVAAIDAARRAKDPVLEEKARKNLQLLVQDPKKKEQKNGQNKDQNNQKQQPENQNKDSNKNEKGSGKPEQDPKQEPRPEPKPESGSEPRPEQKPEQKNEENEKRSDPQKNGDQKKDENPSRGDQSARQKPEEKNGSAPFESKKMTAEDANRVMRELSDRENLLQEKLQKIRGKIQNNPKDW